MRAPPGMPAVWGGGGSPRGGAAGAEGQPWAHDLGDCHLRIRILCSATRSGEEVGVPFVFFCAAIAVISLFILFVCSKTKHGLLSLFPLSGWTWRLPLGRSVPALVHSRLPSVTQPQTTSVWKSLLSAPTLPASSRSVVGTWTGINPIRLMSRSL